jgi:tetratricopeptide (TPR) repeat protein
VRVRERQIALEPSSTIAYVAQAVSFVNWRGDTVAARRTLDRAVTAAGRPRLLQMLTRQSGVRVARVLWPALDGETRRALDTLSAATSQSATWRVYRLKADHSELSGRAALARVYHDSARASAAAALRERPSDPELHAALGLAYAGLGRSREALREGQRAIALDSAGRRRRARAVDAVHGGHHRGTSGRSRRGARAARRRAARVQPHRVGVLVPTRSGVGAPARRPAPQAAADDGTLTDGRRRGSSHGGGDDQSWRAFAYGERGGLRTRGPAHRLHVQRRQVTVPVRVAFDATP